MKIVRMVLIVFIVAGGKCYCQNQYGFDIKFERLSYRVVLVSGSQFSTNQLAVHSDKGIILIDTGISPEYAEVIKDSLSRIFGTSVFACIINTHHHWDHVQGNQVFAGTDIIAHMNCDAGMREQKPAEDISRGNIRREDNKMYGDSLPPPPPSHILVDGENGYDLTVPSISFYDRMKASIGNITLHLLYYGECHTDNDIIIYIPEVRLLAVGDLFFKNSLPQIGSRKNLDVNRWLNTLGIILNEENRIDFIIPGHNEIFARKDLVEYFEYLKALSAGIKNEILRGKSLEYTTEEYSLKYKFPGLLVKDMVDNNGLSLHNGNIRKLYNYFVQMSVKTR